MQIAIMINPQGAPIVPGSGGLRKLRCSRPDSAKGKSGGLRVCYVYFEHSGLVVLVTAYAKGEMDNLTAKDVRSVREMIHFVERELREGR